MTITELIDRLIYIRDCEGDLRVLVSGYEDDYDTPGNVRCETVCDMGAETKKESWWNGRWRDVDDADGDYETERAVVIPR